MTRSLAAAVIAVTASLAACAGAASDSAGPTFDGDAGSRFCRLVRDADPVPDPFEQGLRPDEVESRVQTLERRFREVVDVAPPELDDEVRELVAALEGLDRVLAEHGYDFEAVARSRAELFPFDQERFAATSIRIEAYRREVCGF